MYGMERKHWRINTTFAVNTNKLDVVPLLKSNYLVSDSGRGRAFISFLLYVLPGTFLHLRIVQGWTLDWSYSYYLTAPILRGALVVCCYSRIALFCELYDRVILIGSRINPSEATHNSSNPDHDPKSTQNGPKLALTAAALLAYRA